MTDGSKTNEQAHLKRAKNTDHNIVHIMWRHSIILTASIHFVMKWKKQIS